MTLADDLPFDAEEAIDAIEQAEPLDVADIIKQRADHLAESGTTLDQLVALTHLKRQLDRALADTKQLLQPRADELLSDFQDRGTDGERHAATGAMVSITRKVWARAATSKPSACAALKAAGLGDYVEEGFNTNSLSAYFREELKTQRQRRRDAGDLRPVQMTDLLPAELADHIALTEDHALGCSK